MLIVALDFSSEKQAINMVDKLSDTVGIFKVGLELFVRDSGTVDRIIESGKEVFLDLKFFDIPNTVKGANKTVVEKGVFMFNIHTLGGFDYLKEVSEFNKEYAYKLGVRRPILLGVTILTSMDGNDLKSVGIESDIDCEVLKLAQMARDAGLDGVVCSVNEVRRIKEQVGEDFITVTPGIRPAWATKNDQKRTATPEEAAKSGTDYIVVGRPIISSDNPTEAAYRIIKEMKNKQ